VTKKECDKMMRWVRDCDGDLESIDKAACDLFEAVKDVLTLHYNDDYRGELIEPWVEQDIVRAFEIVAGKAPVKLTK